jgi:hypothetical protein
MRFVFVSILLTLGVAVPAAVCRSQTTTSPSPFPVFNRLFAQPTGQNGYEDLVMAGDLIYHNAAFRAALQPGATLTTKRRTLADPDVRKALALLRTGLDKQVASPHTEDKLKALTYAYIQFLSLARLLAIEQYVLLADGQTERAVRSLNDGLRFGGAVRGDHVMITERIGAAIDGSMIPTIVRHIDQLSEHDCDHLLQIAVFRVNPVSRSESDREV